MDRFGSVEQGPRALAYLEQLLIKRSESNGRAVPFLSCTPSQELRTNLLARPPILYVTVSNIMKVGTTPRHETLLVGMVDSKVLDRAELQRLANRIAVAQKAAPSAEKEAL